MRTVVSLRLIPLAKGPSVPLGEEAESQSLSGRCWEERLLAETGTQTRPYRLMPFAVPTDQVTWYCEGIQARVLKFFHDLLEMAGRDREQYNGHGMVFYVR
jgi:hypothetical protein